MKSTPASLKNGIRLFWASILRAEPWLMPLLLTAAGLALFWNGHNYQAAIAQGDHGRDFYCFAATLKGAVPYRDYWWVYGPLMPYYYALMFKLFGLTIPSIITGEIFLKVAAGLFLYRLTRLISGSLWAVAAALWFWLFYPSFFFTYNHTGGVTLIMAALSFLVSYLYTGVRARLYWGLLCVLLLSFVKLNIGACFLFCYIVSVAVIDSLQRRSLWANRAFYLAGSLAVPGIIALTYGLLIKGLPLYALRQCFPFLISDQQARLPLSLALTVYRNHALQVVTASAASKTAFGLAAAGLLGTIYYLVQKNTDRSWVRTTLSLLILLPLFSLFLLHEYLLSGVHYRIYWASPVNISLMFTLISLPARQAAQCVRVALYAVFLALVTQAALAQAGGNPKTSSRFWDNPRAQAYTHNSAQWISTVEKTVAYLQEHLKPGEPFFVLPYDPLYYYLTDTRAPVRQLIFFYNNHVPPEQETAVIASLERQHVRYVVLSNRTNTPEIGLGYFGKTHCRLLAAYLIDTFKPAAILGEWDHPPDWAEHHGTVILKRKGL